MTMRELTYKKIKISKQTITVKDNEGKTCGMVRGVNSFKDCRANLQVDIWKTIRRYGVDSNKVFYAEGKWWYINDLKWESDYFIYFEDKDEDMDKEYRNRRNIYDALVNENVMEVIDCWIL